MKLLAISLAMLFFAAAPVQAQYYKNKTIEIIVPTDAGDAYDLYARLIGQYLPNYIDGKPQIMIRNMPGASGLKMAEYVYTSNQAGTTIGAMNSTSMIYQLFEPTRFDASKFGLIGTAASSTFVCGTFHTSKIKTFEQAQKEQVILGAVAPSSPPYQYPAFLSRAAGLKAKTIPGYSGVSQVLLAIERGEIDGICLDWASALVMRPQWITEKKFNVLLQIGFTSNPELTAMGVPSVWNYVDPQYRKAVELIISQQVLTRPYVVPPGTPDDVLAILQEAFAKVMTDPQFLADAKKMNLTIAPVPNDQLQEFFDNLFQLPQEIKNQAKELIK